MLKMLMLSLWLSFIHVDSHVRSIVSFPFSFFHISIARRKQKTCVAT